MQKRYGLSLVKLKYLEREKQLLSCEHKVIELWQKSPKSAVKWSVVKCSDVRWNGAVGNLNGVKPNGRVVKCNEVCLKFSKVKRRKCSEVDWSVVGWSVVKWTKGLRNRVCIIIRRCLDHMWFAAALYFSFITFFNILLVLFCIMLYMVVCFVCFCLILYKYLLCILIVMYVPFWVFCFIVLFCVLFVYNCVQ